MVGRRQGHAPRRFPPPWSVEEQKACFVVRDHNGQKLAYLYFEGRARPAISDKACGAYLIPRG
jgi:hypothetical protein